MNKEQGRAADPSLHKSPMILSVGANCVRPGTVEDACSYGRTPKPSPGGEGGTA